MVLENDSKWNKRGTPINQRHREKKLLQSSKDNMLRNLISVDMKMYALQRMFSTEFCESPVRSRTYKTLVSTSASIVLQEVGLMIH